MNKTGISWTDYTWNPVSGCSKVSEGCKFCYAEAWSRRFRRSFSVQEHFDRLKQVEKIPAGAKVFVNSMSDLFHEEVSETMRDAIFSIMEKRKDVIFQILTKRPKIMKDYFDRHDAWPTKNVWIGVSIEMRKYLDRMEILKQTNGQIKFVSFEPLLEDVGYIDLSGISWVIIGGESGPYHRPIDIEWARDIVRQAKEQGVAVWMKQLGGLRPEGNLEDFPEDLRIREFPKMKEEARA